MLFDLSLMLVFCETVLTTRTKNISQYQIWLWVPCCKAKQIFLSVEVAGLKKKKKDCRGFHCSLWVNTSILEMIQHWYWQKWPEGKTDHGKFHIQQRSANNNIRWDKTDIKMMDIWLSLCYHSDSGVRS